MIGGHEQFPALVRTAREPRGAHREHVPACVFYHLPKTAGTTFRRLLETLYAPERVCGAEIDRELTEADTGARPRFGLYAGHFGTRTLATGWPGAIKLVFLRDPVERIVSEHANISDWDRYPENWRRRVEAEPTLSDFVARIRGTTLEQYLALDDPLVSDRTTNRQTRHLLLDRASDETTALPTLDVWNHSRVLVEHGADDAAAFPLWDEGMVVEAQKAIRERFAFVGVQELFELSLGVMAATFGMRPITDTSAYSANRNPLIEPEAAGAGRYDLPAEVREELERRNRMDLAVWRSAREAMLDTLERFGAELAEADAAMRTQERAISRLSGEIGSAPRSTTVLLDTNDHFPGFHRAEMDGDGRPFRWTGYEQTAVVEAEVDAMGASSLHVEVELFNAIHPRAIEEMKITVDNRPLEGIRVERTAGEGRRIAGRVRLGSPPAPRRVHTVKLAGPHFDEPALPHQARRLGVAVHRVRLSADGERTV